jgi:hypothetical protein
MPKASNDQQSPVIAVQKIFAALEPLDEETRRRVIVSALSLLGMGTPSTEPLAPFRQRMSTTQTGEPTQKQVERRLSPVELFQEKQPATNPQKIALFAYYRERFEGKSRFSRTDLKDYFAKAKESPPANYDRDFNSVVKQGWIHEDGDESYLTSKGLEAVEAGFGGKAKPRGRAAAKRLRRHKSATDKSSSQKRR